MAGQRTREPLSVDAVRTPRSFRALVGILAIPAAFALAGCTTPPPANPIAARNAALGIEPDTVPSYLMRPDGLMLNGLLPEQHANEL